MAIFKKFLEYLLVIKWQNILQFPSAVVFGAKDERIPREPRRRYSGLVVYVGYFSRRPKAVVSNRIRNVWYTYLLNIKF